MIDTTVGKVAALGMPGPGGAATVGLACHSISKGMLRLFKPMCFYVIRHTIEAMPSYAEARTRESVG